MTMRAVIASETLVLLCGDSKALDLGEGVIDAVVTDPPYELGFMGKKWDASGIAYDVGLWRAIFRALKPGGHLLAFGGTRTYHRMACAIEDAGFEIRDSLHWVYGCLTDDVDVLTENGWRRGIDLAEGDIVAQWCPATGAITRAAVQETFRAPWSGDLVRFKNSDTDQLLTPNHRVWHRSILRGGGRRGAWSEYQVDEAGAISRRVDVRLPLSGLHDGPGIGGEDYAALLGWVWTEGGLDPAPSTGVRLYQSSVNADKVAEIDALLDRLGAHRRYSYEREHEYRHRGWQKYQAITWYWSGELAERVRGDLPGKHPTFDLLWRMTLAEKRAFLTAALLGDGSQNKRTGSWGFEQKDPADREWFCTLLALVGWRGQNCARKARDGGSVSISQRADTQLSRARLLEDQREHYEGDVWCVRVPTGAFVARRGGQIFITGNSGFPKSLNVSKAIDDSLGAERPVIGPNPNSRPNMVRVEATVLSPRVDAPLTAPGSPEAERWNGWGTALKPAHEPIVLARKPLAGTVAANVLAHGTGGLNVDGCRIGTDDTRSPTGRRDNGAHGDDWGMKAGAMAGSACGRWPANFVLSHSEGCEVFAGYGPTAGEGIACAPGCPVAELDRQSGPRAGSGNPERPVTRGGSRASDGWGLSEAQVAPGARKGSVDGASRFFYVAKPSGKERDFGCEDLPARSGGEATDRVDGSDGLNSPRAGAGRKGGRRNYHPTVKPIELMRWLVRLVTPPGGAVLDPFCGSGTTGIAAIREGFSFVGIEQSTEYVEIAAARLRAALKEKEPCK